MESKKFLTPMQRRRAIEDLVAESHVALVGGSDSFERLRVESYPIVARVNHNFERQGGRVDALYVGPGVETKFSEAPSKFLVYPDAQSNPVMGISWHSLASGLGIESLPYDPNCYLDLNPAGAEFEWTNILTKQLQTMPLTGILAIAHLLSLPIRTLFLTGFDFYSSTNEGIPYVRHSHRMVPQIEWLRYVVKSDRRVEPDANLSRILDWNVPMERVVTWNSDGHRFVKKSQEEESSAMEKRPISPAS